MRATRDTTVVAWAGDGGTFDIGLQALSGAAERNDDIIYVCYDNEAYMNTGIQRSSATPYGAWTTTTPGKHSRRGRRRTSMASWPRTASPTRHRLGRLSRGLDQEDQEGQGDQGTRFFHVFAPCPPGWKAARGHGQAGPPGRAERAISRSTRSRTAKYTQPKAKRKPVVDTSLQGRFKHLTAEQIASVQAEADARWERLLKGCGA